MTQSTPALIVGNIEVRQHAGLFLLNDLHRAAGGEKRHQPNHFLSTDQTKALVEALKAESLPTVQTVVGKGKAQGTYACRELVIAYAAWISAAFHLKVIRVFLAVAAPQPEPIQTALDYDRISTAQAQDLKEIINAIVEAKVHKTHGEAWARFQNKFRVNSYLELPATRHLEARQYLIAKLPGGYQGEVLAPVQDAERLQLAFDLATQTSAQVQRTVFNAVMEGAQDEWRYSRYLFAFTYDRLSDKPTLPWAKAVQHDQLIVSLDDLPRRIEGPDAVLATDAQLAAIARACLNRIEARAISA